VDTKQLITFVTLSEEKNYSKVAQKLNYASSTLMEHVRSLEEELGCRLTEREGKYTVLTGAGKEFLNYAQKMLILQKQAKEAVETSDGTDRVRIATAESIGQYSLARLFNEYTLHYPESETIIKVGNCSMFPEMLLNKQIELGYVYGMSNFRAQGIESVPLFWEPLHFVVQPDHPLAQYDEVKAEDFAKERFALTYEDCCYAMALKEMLARQGVSPKAQNHLGSVNMIKSYIKQNRCVALLPRAVIKEDLAKGNLCCLNWSGEEFTALAQVLYLKGRALTEPMQRLLDLSVKYAKTRSSARLRNVNAQTRPERSVRNTFPIANMSRLYN